MWSRGRVTWVVKVFEIDRLSVDLSVDLRQIVETTITSTNSDPDIVVVGKVLSFFFKSKVKLDMIVMVLRLLY